MSQDTKPTAPLLPIATLLTAAERPRVDAAGEGYYRALHRESVEDLIRDLKAHHVHAVLVSVTCGGPHAVRVASLVREFPRVPAVALLSELEAKTPHAVLALGQSGIRRLVDVRHPRGWQELRGALMADSGDSGQRVALGQLATDLAGAPDDCWRFFETLFTCSPRVGNVRQLARDLGVLPSTLMSRFFRAGLPAPKRYLAMARLVRAARLFENVGFSIANVANHMDYSSPQSFGRHVRTLLHMTAGGPPALRRRWNVPAIPGRARGSVSHRAANASPIDGPAGLGERAHPRPSDAPARAALVAANRMRRAWTPDGRPEPSSRVRIEMASLLHWWRA